MSTDSPLFLIYVANRPASEGVSIAEKVSRADYVIRTDGSFEETDRQVRAIFDALSVRN